VAARRGARKRASLGWRGRPGCQLGYTDKIVCSTMKRVGVTLRLQRINGIVRSATGTGQYMVWEIAR
jgi:hypothetical protein